MARNLRAVTLVLDMWSRARAAVSLVATLAGIIGVIAFWVIVHPAWALLGGAAIFALVGTGLNQLDKWQMRHGFDVEVVGSHAEYSGRGRHVARIEILSTSNGRFRAWLVDASVPRQAEGRVPLGWANEGDAVLSLYAGIPQKLNLGEMERKESGYWTLAPFGPGFPDIVMHSKIGPGGDGMDIEIDVRDIDRNVGQSIRIRLGYRDDNEPYVRPMTP